MVRQEAAFLLRLSESVTFLLSLKTADIYVKKRTSCFAPAFSLFIWQCGRAENRPYLHQILGLMPETEVSLLAQTMMFNIRHVEGKALKHEALFSTVNRSQHLVTQTPLCCIKGNQQFGRNTEMRRQSRWRLPARFSLYRAAVGAAFNTNNQFYSIWKTAWIFFFFF